MLIYVNWLVNLTTKLVVVF